MNVRVQCPNPECGQHYHVPQEKLGHAAVCHKCKRKFILTLARSANDGVTPIQTAREGVPDGHASGSRDDTAITLLSGASGETRPPEATPAPPPLHRTMAEETNGAAPPVPMPASKIDVPSAAAGGHPAAPIETPARPSQGAPGNKPASVPGAGVPRKLGRFEIQERLGAGAFGAVYRARDPVLDREVALKVPHATTLQSESRRARFLVEAKAAAQLRHPNIVPVYEAGNDGETYYIASAFIDGQTLEDAMDDGQFRTAASESGSGEFLPELWRTVQESWNQPGLRAKVQTMVAGLRQERAEGGTDPSGIAEQRVDFRRAAKLILTLAHALDYAHHFHIVHRDVKPANIMLDASGEPLVMDFGLARMHEAAGVEIEGGANAAPDQALGRRPLAMLPGGSGDAQLTQDGTILGTPAYMAPEQAKAQQDLVGPVSDQYSLGAVLYELLCSEPPFAGPPDMVLHLVRTQDPPPPRTVSPRIPVDLEAICLKAMSKDVRRRYANCGELAEDLRRWLDGEPITARHSSSGERLARWCRRNPIVAALSGAAALLLLLVAIVAGIGYASTSRALGTAQSERKRAEDALGREESERKRAEQSLQKEAAALKKALYERERADSALAKQTKANQALAARLYASLLTSAQFEATAKRYAKASELLDQCEPDLRSWEWHFLRRDLRFGGALPISLPDGQLAMLSDGRLVELERAYTDRTSARESLIAREVASGKQLLRIEDSEELPLRDIETSCCGQKLVGIDRERRVHLWDLATGQGDVHSLLGAQESFFQDRMAVTGSRLAALVAQGRADENDALELRVWDVASARETCRVTSADLDVPKDLRSILRELEERHRTSRLQSIAKEIPITLSRDGDRVAISLPKRVEIRHKDVIRTLGRSYGYVSVISLWDASSGRRVMAVVSRETWRLALSPDALLLADADEFRVAVWSVPSGELRHEFREGTSSGQPRALVFSADGRRLAVCRREEQRVTQIGGYTSGPEPKVQVKVWEIPTEPTVRPSDWHPHLDECEEMQEQDERNFVLLDRPEPSQSMLFARDAKTLLVASVQGGVKTWRLEQPCTLFLNPWTMHVPGLCFSPDGATLVAMGWSHAPPDDIGHREGNFGVYRGGRLVLWNVLTGQRTRVVKAHDLEGYQVLFSPNGNLVATTGRTVHTPDAKGGQPKYGGTKPSESEVAVKLIPKSHDPFSDTSWPVENVHQEKRRPKYELKIWDTKSWEVTLVLPGERIAVFSPDGKRLAAVVEGCRVRVWNVATGQELFTSIGHSETIQAIAYSRDGTLILSAGIDGTIKLWNAANGALAQTLAGHKTSVNALAVSSDGDCFASAGDDETIKVWSLRTNSVQSTLVGHTGPIVALSFNPNGSRLASVSRNGQLKIWNPQSQSELLNLSGWNGPVMFSPDGSRLAATAESESLEADVRLFNGAPCLPSAETLGDALNGGQVRPSKEAP